MSLKRWWQTTLNPERYHGPTARQPYFEGWYYKLVDPTGTHTLAVIPGIFLGEDPDRHHAFVQIFEGATGRVEHIRYPVQAFEATSEGFDIRIGPNRFSRTAITLDLPDVKGTVDLIKPVPWPVTVRSPGIMGWYAWVPTMECYHGVVSLDHGLAGRLQLGEATVDFTGGRGYTEKDWGQNFPKTWVWMQSNHFETEGTSLTASIAQIPWRRTTFPGFIVGFWHGGTLHRFATYTGAKVEHLHVGDTEVQWTLTNRTHRLDLRAQRVPGAMLYAPTPKDMIPRVEETVQATVEVTLATQAGMVVFEGTGRYAGLEVMGEGLGW